MSAAEQNNERPRSPGVLKGMFEKRCPRCRHGRMYRSLWRMNTHCPVCGVDFYRGDPGYFTGAMYASYAMAIPLLSVLTVIEYLILPEWSLFGLVLLASAVSTPLIPWIWQYSRVLWIYFDRYFDPEEEEGTDRPGAEGR